MAGLKVLLTGATGYIGGSVLSTILESKDPAIKNISLSTLVRGEANAKLLTQKGVHVELFQDLGQTELLESLASNYDVVIQCVHGTHVASAAALIRGLAKHTEATGRQTYYVHTSGTSNLGDLPLSGQHHESHVFSDKENIYAYEKYRESMHHYDQRENDISVVENGLASGVKTIIVMPPTIYGIGSGFFNQLSVQIPTMFRMALKYGRAVKIGNHHSEGTQVHIDDLVVLYEMLLVRIVQGKEVPYGEKGILFTGAGSFSWVEVSSGVARTLKKKGRLDTEELYIMSLEEAAVEFGGGDPYAAEVGFAANYRTSSDIARDWGWKPLKTHDDFLETFDLEVDTVLAGNTEVKYAGHLGK